MALFTRGSVCVCVCFTFSERVLLGRGGGFARSTRGVRLHVEAVARGRFEIGDHLLEGDFTHRLLILHFHRV